MAAEIKDRVPVYPVNMFYVEPDGTQRAAIHPSGQNFDGQLPRMCDGCIATHHATVFENPSGALTVKCPGFPEDPSHRIVVHTAVMVMKPSTRTDLILHSVSQTFEALVKHQNSGRLNCGLNPTTAYDYREKPFKRPLTPKQQIRENLIKAMIFFRKGQTFLKRRISR